MKPSALIEHLRLRVEARAVGLIGDVGLFDIALKALEICATRQARVAAWVVTTFGPETALDAPERSLRAAEEVIELAQACGVAGETIHRLVDYVYARPPGVPKQEIGGSMLTLYAAAQACGVDADEAYEAEMQRVERPEVVDRCQRRQLEKREALLGDLVVRSEVEGHGV